MPTAPLRTTLLTALALIAFAGNSLLCRAALGERAIDPVTFTAVRVTAGALALLPFLRGGAGRGSARAWNPTAAAALFAYALCFSLAYVSLDAGTGALLLFGAVQITMIGMGFRGGERATLAQCVGFAAAVAGVLLLIAPGVTAPAPIPAMLMCGAGLSWGGYSLLGRGLPSPSAATARNFALASPAAWLVLLPAVGSLHAELRGVLLAIASGALTSGVGYVIWYAALRGHSATSAAIVQLAVPVLAAGGGVLLLGEHVTGRLLAASALTLGGVAVAILARRSDADRARRGERRAGR